MNFDICGVLLDLRLFHPSMLNNTLDTFPLAKISKVRTSRLVFKVPKDKGVNRADSQTCTLIRKASSDIDRCEAMLQLTSDIYNANAKALEDYQAHGSVPPRVCYCLQIPWFRDDPDLALNASETPPALAPPPCEEDSTLFETKAENLGIRISNPAI